MLNKRNFFRVDLLRQLIAEVSLIHSITNEVTTLTNVCVENISASGMLARTKINLPNKDGILFQFTFKVMNKDFSVQGKIVGEQEGDSIYSYRIKFIVDSATEKQLIMSLNQLAIAIKKDEGLPQNCSFMQESDYKEILR